MKRALMGLLALVGAGLVFASGTVLADSPDPPEQSVNEAASAQAARQIADEIDGPAVRVRGALLVVNEDGSASIGASLQNLRDAETALMGVVVSVDGRRLAVNATEMWLPVPVGQPAQVGAASDAGGFVVPDGVEDASRAEIEFRFDDGTCVLTEVTAVARTDEHRSVYPRSGRPLGPVTTDEPPAGTGPCDHDRSSTVRVAG